MHSCYALSGKKEGVMQKAGAKVLAATEVVKMMYAYVKKLLIDGNKSRLMIEGEFKNRHTKRCQVENCVMEDRRRCQPGIVHCLWSISGNCQSAHLGNSIFKHRETAEENFK